MSRICDKLSGEWMYYCGLLAMHGAEADDLKHISDLLELEEKGLIRRFPCNIGDVIFFPGEDSRIHPFVVDSFSINKYWEEFKASYCGREEKLKYWEIRFPFSDIGKRFFPTRTEAEQKLKKDCDGKGGAA